jgi:hypothetical protein
MQGEILAARGKHNEAIALMEEAAGKDHALYPKEYFARVLSGSGQHERAQLVYSQIVNHPWIVWSSPESEWPGLRFLAKQYLQQRKGE